MQSFYENNKQEIIDILKETIKSENGDYLVLQADDSLFLVHISSEDCDRLIITTKSGLGNDYDFISGLIVSESLTEDFKLQTINGIFPASQYFPSKEIVSQLQIEDELILEYVVRDNKNVYGAFATYEDARRFCKKVSVRFSPSISKIDKIYKS